MARIAVIGLGYVGLTTMAAFTELGHSVTGIDLDKKKVELLHKGQIPFHEPGLQRLYKTLFESSKLDILESYEGVLQKFEFVFICVSTPSSPTGQADLVFVEAAITSVKPLLATNAIVVLKSTVPIGTSVRFKNELTNQAIRVAANPEFLSEGTAIEDFLNPSRIVVGADDKQTALEVMALYDNVPGSRIICGLASAESIKYASNAFLALKLSFVNEMASLANATGASMADISLGMSLDARIGDKFLRPGPGWGGSCFPKDTSELSLTAQRYGSRMLTVEAAIESNRATMVRMFEAFSSQLGIDLKGCKIAIWGLAFKANTDDVRESPAIEIATMLAKQGARVTAYDPLVKRLSLSFLHLEENPLDACFGAEALLILTEAEEFSLIDPLAVKERMAPNPAIFDGRAIINLDAWSPHFKNLKAVGQ